MINDQDLKRIVNEFENRYRTEDEWHSDTIDEQYAFNRFRIRRQMREFLRNNPLYNNLRDEDITKLVNLYISRL